MFKSKFLLLATVSSAALFLTEIGATAADLAKPVPVLPDLSLARGRFALTVGGYGFLQGDKGVSSAADYFVFDPLRPMGWGASFAANYRFSNSPWSIGLNAHFGKTRKKSKRGLATSTASTIGNTSNTETRTDTHTDTIASFAPSSNNAPIRGGNVQYTHFSDNYTWDRSSSHAVVDFTVGRDMGLGQTKAGDPYLELVAGLRYAKLRDSYHWKDIGNSHVSTSGSATDYGYAGAYTGMRRFTGIGPRFGYRSSIPIGQSQFTFDSGAGFSVLFGRSSTSETIDWTSDRDGESHNKFSSRKNRATLGLDVNLGMSYLFTPNAKISAGYRGEWFGNVFGPLDNAPETFSSQSKNFMTHAAYVEATFKF